jgi:Zn finger protein HypA/HybF involved in hydrogenase expression
MDTSFKKDKMDISTEPLKIGRFKCDNCGRLLEFIYRDTSKELKFYCQTCYKPYIITLSKTAG